MIRLLVDSASDILQNNAENIYHKLTRIHPTSIGGNELSYK